MPVLDTCKFSEDPIKNDSETMETPFFQLCQWELLFPNKKILCMFYATDCPIIEVKGKIKVTPPSDSVKSYCPL